MGQLWRRAGLSAGIGLLLALGGGAPSWAARGDHFRRQNIQATRQQIKADRQAVHATGSHFKAATQAVRSGRKDVNQRIKNGEFNVPVGSGIAVRPSKGQRREIRQQVLDSEKVERFEAKRDHKYTRSLLKADKTVMAGLKGQGRSSSGSRELVQSGPKASKAARQDTRNWITQDKALLSQAKGNVRASKAELKATRADINQRIKNGEFNYEVSGIRISPTKGQRAQIRRQATADARVQLNADKLNLKGERAILNVHKNQLRLEQGYRRVQ